MLEQKTTDFLEALSSKEPVPGGGGASAAVGAFASALGMMVANLTAGKKTYAAVEEEILETKERLLTLQKELIRLTDEDAKAFEPLSRAYGLPRETEEEKAERARIMEAALYEASRVPLQIMQTVRQVMELLRILGEKGSRIAISDVGVGILFAQAALEGASLNIYINTRLMQEKEQVAKLNAEADALIREARTLKEEIYLAVLEKIR
ncbi:cyclodeaminase/cyclohydrolase family protein [Suipraeoptans intestinalis]|uniref:cyclodeaminase/cyclohydrolase family protein n=1 Tax=Suipraeoptans intestinalis TaxID=2606628 RepID=UPI0023F0F1D2|nr:cyclodeaminase/cyclohydrolase family protein [Suipraeoptans intestinalis]MDD7770029.1 cyclodeaminase/cyclohydrolase family protein [Suipraeoptans intestinalis]MDY3121057.1 cyclodeaminase/cyclohydrolase family protein [Suipraeoptans intestinalis]